MNTNKNISYVQVIGTIYNIYNTDGLLIGGYGDERKLVSGPTVSGNTFTIVLEDMYGEREVLTLDSSGILVHTNDGGKNPNIGENSDKPKVTSIPTTTNNITNEYKKVTKVSVNKNKEVKLINNSKQGFGCLISLYHIINILVMTFFTYTIFTENMNGNDVKGACAVTAAWGFIHSFSKLKWLYIIIILINLIMYLL